MQENVGVGSVNDRSVVGNPRRRQFEPAPHLHTFFASDRFSVLTSRANQWHAVVVQPFGLYSRDYRCGKRSEQGCHIVFVHWRTQTNRVGVHLSDDPFRTIQPRQAANCSRQRRRLGDLVSGLFRRWFFCCWAGRKWETSRLSCPSFAIEIPLFQLVIWIFVPPSAWHSRMIAMGTDAKV